LVWDAVSVALGRAKAEIEALQASDASQVPIDTGQLRSSFKVALSPGQLFMQWSALSPQGFDYAKVQDVGRANMVGKFYSETMKEQAKEIVLKNLRDALAEHLAAGA